MLAAGEKNRACLTCGKELKGRSDKKFCNDACRNTYNNQLNSATNNFIKNINNKLIKNRRILETLLLSADKKIIHVKRENLQLLNFHFKYMTHTYTNTKGEVYHYCYDYGYLVLDNEWLLVVKSKERE